MWADLGGGNCWSCQGFMCSCKWYQVWDKGIFALLILQVPRWLTNVFGQKSLDHPISFLFILILFLWVPLHSTSWVMTLVRSSKCCTQVSIKPLIKTKNFYSHKMIEPNLINPKICVFEFFIFLDNSTLQVLGCYRYL